MLGRRGLHAKSKAAPHRLRFEFAFILALVAVSLTGIANSQLHLTASSSTPTTSVLSPGAQLSAGMSLTSANGHFDLRMQTDGNLVEYTSSGLAEWASGTNQIQPLGSYVTMQADGNLVIYDGDGKALWASDTPNNPDAYLSLGDFGQLSVNAGYGSALWEPGNVTPGTKLSSGASIVLPGGQFRLTMQHDGNLVEYTATGVAVWASGTNPAGAFSVMQSDGNLVVYNNVGQPLWASNTAGNPGADLSIDVLGQLEIESSVGSPLWELGTLPSNSRLSAGSSIVLPGGQFRLTMQNDGNLVEYTASGVAVWATGTNPAGAFSIMQSDGNLVVYNSISRPLWASNTAGNPGAVLRLNVLGTLVVESRSGVPLWGPGVTTNVNPGALPSSAELGPGQSVMTDALPGGQQFELTMDPDGNLVEHGVDGTTVWSTGTDQFGSFTVMQGDGNLVVYNSVGLPLWASNTAGNPGAILTLGNFGQLAVESTVGIAFWTTPLGAPGLPATIGGVTALAGNGSVPDRAASVSWTAPTPSAGAPLWGYSVVASPGGRSAFAQATATTATVTGLTDGVSYTFTVSGLNAAGSGTPNWPPSNPVTPRAAPVTPGAPTGIEAVPGDGLITVSWQGPVDNGGSPISGYAVTANPGGEQTTLDSVQQSDTLEGMTNGVTYSITVSAMNSLGAGTPSQPSAPVTPSTVPFPPGSTIAGDANPGDWSMYNYDSAGSNWNSAETAISVTSAHTMSQAASLGGLGFVQASMPIVAFGSVFVGSMNGFETSLTTGTLSRQWSTFLGTDGPVATCPNSYPYGVVSSPTAAIVNGTTKVIYLSGGDSAMYALNATTGAILWRTQLAPLPNNFSFVSPLLVDGALYTGVASYGDCPLVQGQVFKIDPLTGAIEATLDIAPAGCIGGGLWGSPSMDSAGHIFFATGTEVDDCPNSTQGVEGWQLETSLVEADADLNLVSYWHLPEIDQIGDSDFGSVPTVYDDELAPGSGQMVAVANKNGTVYAFDSQALSGGPVWQTVVAQGNENPALGGSIAPMAFDGSRLYVGGGQTEISGQTCGAGLRALDPATGAVLWADCFPQGPLIGAVSDANGVVVACVHNSVVGVNAATGVQLFDAPVPGTGDCWGGAAISNGNIYAADGGGAVVDLAPHS